jgi:hypothetical protein
MTTRSPFPVLQKSPEIVSLAVMLSMSFRLALWNEEAVSTRGGIKFSHETCKTTCAAALTEWRGWGNGDWFAFV